MTAPRSRSRRRPYLAPLVAGLGALLTLGMLAGAGSAVAADQPAPRGIGITVTVSPAPGPAVAPPAAPTTSNTTTRTTVNGSTVVTGNQNPPLPAEGVASLGGILYISGLHNEYTPSINPLGGEVRTSFTVLNVSNAIIDSTAKFWVTNAFGAELSAVGPIDVTGLKPNESRTIDATLTGVGQWTFATTHMTLTPPETVDGVALQPLTRDAFVFLPPWFLLVLVAIAAGAYAVVRILRGEPETEPSLVESTA
ncbi:hypothetical protein [Herbiconiux sp. UC225_62]|uniref:hypothetical protein n=1 Tax=Herbiconiux sp. UC225_62 TaxID=3350168 RepID=UPI0036D3EF83